MPPSEVKLLCIFCKSDSSSSVSIEHIIPESLWNTKHVLPRGIVCDACNNYFSRKVEKPFLDAPTMQQLRFAEGIPNKLGRVPIGSGILAPGYAVRLHRTLGDDAPLSIDLAPEGYSHIARAKSGTLILPMDPPLPEDRLVSRFLAKMALEALALRLLSFPGGVEFVGTDPQFEPLRIFARRGSPERWPFHSRRIYPPDRRTLGPDGEALQTVHEFDFLYTEHQEVYFVFALFGLELTINLGGPEIDGYLQWLTDHHGASPLYFGKNAQEESAAAPR